MNQEIFINTAEKQYKINPKRFGAFVLVACLGLGVATFGAKEAFKNFSDKMHPDFSKATTEYLVQPGDGIDNAVFEIDGIDNIDYRNARDYVENMPENAETLKNGLHPGESLTIPVSVSTGSESEPIADIVDKVQ